MNRDVLYVHDIYQRDVASSTPLLVTILFQQYVSLDYGLQIIVSVLLTTWWYILKLLLLTHWPTRMCRSALDQVMACCHQKEVILSTKVDQVICSHMLSPFNNEPMHLLICFLIKLIGTYMHSSVNNGMVVLRALEIVCGVVFIIHIYCTAIGGPWCFDGGYNMSLSKNPLSGITTVTRLSSARNNI